jgi:hypothetical protein
MKKLFLSSFLFIPLFLQAQYNYMALNFGISQPVGSYSEATNLTSNGFAYRGMSADYSGAYYFKRWFGITGDLKFASNTINNQKVKDLLIQEVPISPESDTSISYDLGYWKHVSFLVGPQVTLAKGNFSADVYATAGLCVVMNPSLGINVTVGGESFSRSTYPQYLRFGFDVGTAFRLKINDDFGIRFYGSYFQTSAKGKIHNELTLTSKQVDIKSYSTLVQTFNFGIGIVYILNKGEENDYDLRPY